MKKEGAKRKSERISESRTRKSSRKSQQKNNEEEDTSSHSSRRGKSILTRSNSDASSNVSSITTATVTTRTTSLDSTRISNCYKELAQQCSQLTPQQPQESVITQSNEKITKEQQQSIPEHSIEYESDPETVYDCPVYTPSQEFSHNTTIHWDPNSFDGKLIGYPIKIYDVVQKDWKQGRIIRFDPNSYKHKIKFKKSTKWTWISEEISEIFGDIVWALVKGFAWWPAQIILPLDDDDNNKKKVSVKFFGSDEMATIKNVPEFIRPFKYGHVDSVISKCKKKRNARAIALAKDEEEKIRMVRKDAVLFYARKAYEFMVYKSHALVGKKIRMFRNDVNYPYGETLEGIVRLYNPTLNKWLVVPLGVEQKKSHDAFWYNIEAKECNLKILEKKKTSASPSEFTLSPYLFDYHTYQIDKNSIEANFEKYCMACLKYLSSSSKLLQCIKCQRRFHQNCIDPFSSNEEDNDKWICDKCKPCRGCGKLDIVFGVKKVTPPSTLFLEPGAEVNLCTMCIPLYETKCFCPNCGHSFNDEKHQRTLNSLQLFHYERSLHLDRKQSEHSPPVADPNEEKTEEKTEETSGTNSLQPQETIRKVELSWFRPQLEPPVWGYTNASMLLCDSCNLWVHAGCANLSKEEYALTNEGNHPIYSIEFLCRSCCRKRALAIVTELQEHDQMYLFALPVTEEVAPTYSDIIKNPMDLSTMMERAETQVYFNYVWIRDLFELMVWNALVFNTPNSKYWNEAKRFHSASLAVFNKLAKAFGTKNGMYHENIIRCFQKAEDLVQNEMDRLKEDETTTKKDLVLGAQYTAIDIPTKLAKLPFQPESCVPYVPIRNMKPAEAFFTSWMECCFSCGSSGAPDTMLFCVDCGEAYHSFCVNAPIFSMSPSMAAGWRCPNCKLCEITGVVPEDDSRLIYCEMCDRAFTLDLLEPPLISVPSGLFICGQCVNCRECHNESEKKRNSGKISRKYWSAHPRLCYRCHGCKGLVEKQVKGMDCPVCNKLFRKGDEDLVLCSTCQKHIHIDCDPEAMNVHLNNKAIESPALEYKCIKCRKARKEKPAKVAPTSSVQNHDTAIEDTSQDPKLWDVLEPCRKDYECLINDAITLFSQIEKRMHMFLLKESTNPKLLPPWMLARAARFIRVMKLRSKSKRRFSKRKRNDAFPVIDVYRKAVNSAAFVVVACHVMRLNIWCHAKSFDKMPSFLIAPLKEIGCVHLPADIIEESKTKLNFLVCEMETQQTIDANTAVEEKEGSNIASAASKDNEHEKKDEKTNENSEMVEEVQAKVMIKNNTLAETREAMQCEDEVHPAKPLRGWDNILSENDVNSHHPWTDPRSCCLCHTCGDDDDYDDEEPVQEEGDSENATEKENNEAKPSSVGSDKDFELNAVGKCGRLLPFSNGLWIHSACALWSSEVWESESGLVHSVEKARSRGAKLKCFGCGRSGATLGCHKHNCSRNYHYPCAVACGVAFTTNRQLFCRLHRENVQSILDNGLEQMKVLKSAADQSAQSIESTMCYRQGTLVIHALGEIEQDYDGFHSETFITPPGYIASRIFWSYKFPRTRIVYILKVERSSEGKPCFTIIAADDPMSRIQGNTANEAFNTLLKKVNSTNESLFADDMNSVLPVQRRESRKKHYLLAPSQFFGFGLLEIRKNLESLPGIEALIVPLSDDSKAYKFCFNLPSEDKVTELQRKRAAKAAENDLINPSGCARTEGMTAIDKSESGRITLALVRHVDEELTNAEDVNVVSGKGINLQSNTKRDHSAIQTMFREMKSIPLHKRLAAMRSHIHGWGLFSKIDIKKDSMIIEYTGEIIRQPVADKREKEYEMSGTGSCYMFRLDQERIVDATAIGCMARFMNHSCSNNAYAKIVHIDSDEGVDKKIIVFANRDIIAGEEITYDYKFPVEDGSLRCTCGAANCIGRMN